MSLTATIRSTPEKCHSSACVGDNGKHRQNSNESTRPKCGISPATGLVRVLEEVLPLVEQLIETASRPPGKKAPDSASDPTIVTTNATFIGIARARGERRGYRKQTKLPLCRTAVSQSAKSADRLETTYMGGAVVTAHIGPLDVAAARESPCQCRRRYSRRFTAAGWGSRSACSLA